MLLKNISFDAPAENLLYDDVLLQLSEKETDQDILRLWESPAHFVVLGRIGKVEDDVRLEVARRDRVQILRRSSGGGTVLQGPGCLNYSLILSKERNPALVDLKKSYEYILSKVVSSLKLVNVNANFFPISDIALTDNLKKISGNAQKRGRKFILHHGTILYEFNLDLISKYLKMPKNIPEYRNERNHLDFVSNINVEREAIEKAFENVFEIKKIESKINMQEQLLLNEFKLSKTLEVLS